jgi:hypothetical protein
VHGELILLLPVKMPSYGLSDVTDTHWATRDSSAPICTLNTIHLHASESPVHPCCRSNGNVLPGAIEMVEEPTDQKRGIAASTKTNYYTTEGYLMVDSFAVLFYVLIAERQQ